MLAVETGGKTVPKQIGELKLYSLKEIAKILGVHQVTLRRYINRDRNKLVGRKIGRNWYVSERSLRAFIENRGEDMDLLTGQWQDTTMQK